MQKKKGLFRMKKSKILILMSAAVLLFAFVGCSSEEAVVFGEEIKFPEGTDSGLDENTTHPFTVTVQANQYK